MKRTFFAFVALLFVMVSIGRAQTKKAQPITKPGRPDAVALDCKPLRVGTFKTTIGGKVTTMVRTETMESDYLDSDPVPVVYTLKWKDDCTVVLTPTPETLKKHPNIRKDAIFTLETSLKNTNSYTQTLSANYTQFKTNMEVVKVK